MQLEISHKRVISTWFSEIILCLLFLKINQLKEAYFRVVYSALLHHLRTGSEAQGTLFFFFFSVVIIFIAFPAPAFHVLACKPFLLCLSQSQPLPSLC